MEADVDLVLGRWTQLYLNRPYSKDVGWMTRALVRVACGQNIFIGW